MEALKTQLTSLVAEGHVSDASTSRARPRFLYVMYALLLWAIPMGLIAAAQPETAEAIGRGMTAYLNGLPEPLYALFGTGYLGYTAVRQWGKAKGTDRQGVRFLPRSPANWRAAIEGEEMNYMAKFIARSEEHTSELQSLMRISHAVFCLKTNT